METKGFFSSSYGINEQGLSDVGTAYWNLGSAELVEHAVRLGEGQLAANGALVAETGTRTGRSPNDKFLVQSTPSQELVSWGKINPGVLQDTVVAYCDTTIAFPIFCEYVVGSERGQRPRKELYHQRDDLLQELKRQARAKVETRSVEGGRGENA